MVVGAHKSYAELAIELGDSLGNAGSMPKFYSKCVQQLGLQLMHAANDPKCNELGWACIPLVVEHYARVFVLEARQTRSSLGLMM